MKIRINGETIDTEDIYKIGEIQFLNDVNSVHFTIFFDNKENIRVSKRTYNDSKSCEIFHKKNPEERKQIFDDLIEEVEKFRTDIEKIWMENQSQIPVFNL